MTDSHGERLIRNGFLSFFNNALGMVLGFAVSIMTARLLGPEKYGIYNIILWFVSVVCVVVGMGFNFGLTKFVSEYQGRADREASGKIIRFVLWIELFMCALTMTILILRRRWIADYFFNPDYINAFTICFVGILPGILTAVYSSAIEGIQRFRYFLIYSAAISPISLATKIVILLMGGGIEGLLWTNLFYSLVNMIYYRWVLHREKIRVGIFGGLPPKGIRKRVINYNFSIAAIMMLDKIIWDKSENFFLGKYCNAAQAGFFNVAYGLSNKFTMLISGTFWKVLFPFMSERAGAEDHTRLQRTFYIATRYLAFFAFPIGIGGIVLSFPLIKYVLGVDYIPAQRSLQVFFFCSIFGLLAIPQASVLYAINKQNFIVKYGVFLAAINLILDFIFIPKYGAIAAAGINGIIRAVAYIGGTYYTMKVIDVKLPLKSLFKILYSSIIMAVLMQVVIKVNNEILGFIIAIPIGSVVYLGSSMFIGTFEVEDARVFRKLISFFPKRLQIIFRFAINRIENSQLSE